MPRASIRSRPAVAGVVALLIVVAGCQDVVRKTFYTYRTTTGVFLEPAATREPAPQPDAPALNDTFELLVSGSVQRWPTSRIDRALRELVVNVSFMNEKGQLLKQDGTLDFWIRRYDINRYDKTGGILAAYHADAQRVEHACEESMLSVHYQFRLAVRKDNPHVAAALWIDEQIFVLVEARFTGADGAVLVAKSPPILVENG